MGIAILAPWGEEPVEGITRQIACALIELALRGRFADRIDSFLPLRDLPTLPEDTPVWVLGSPEEVFDLLGGEEAARRRRILLTPRDAFWESPDTVSLPLVDPAEETPPDRPFGPRSRRESVDWVALFWSILQRSEEYGDSTPIDSHERYPSWASDLHRRDWLHRPIADEIALRMGRLLEEIEGQRPPKSFPPSWTLAVTHDIDSIRFWSWRRLGGSILNRAQAFDNRVEGGQAAKRRLPRPDAFLHRVVQAPWIRTLRSSVYHRTDPHWIFPWLRRWEQGHQVRPTVFVLPERRTSYEPYDLRRAELTRLYTHRLIRQIQRWHEEGAEIGLHPPYDAMEHPERLITQRQRVEEVIGGNTVRSARYHWLRFRVPSGWSALEEAGIQNDTTLGHPQEEGFRSGTCHPFLTVDLRSGFPMHVVEVPLIAMDSTLRHYRNLSPGTAFAHLSERMEACRRVGGTFVLLWHTNSFDRYEWKGWQRVFTRIVEDALQKGAISRTISEIADDYRQSRRQLIERVFPRGVD